jgi:hypothetical protein
MVVTSVDRSARMVVITSSISVRRAELSLTLLTRSTRAAVMPRSVAAFASDVVGVSARLLVDMA